MMNGYLIIPVGSQPSPTVFLATQIEGRALPPWAEVRRLYPKAFIVQVDTHDEDIAFSIDGEEVAREFI